MTLEPASTAPRQSLFGRMSTSARRWGRAFRASPATWVGITLLVLNVALLLFGPALAPYSPTQHNFDRILQPPSLEHPFGTDQFGRDVLSRILVGARSTLLIAVAGTALGLAIGVFIGVTAGYFGGLIDEVIMRVMDVAMSFPTLLLAMLILTTLGQASGGVIIAIGIVFIPRVARVVRGVTLSLRNQEFVQAAKLRGESHLYIMLFEILPNASGPLAVEAAMRFSFATLLSASLGFIGLGVQPPDPHWGLMVAEGRAMLQIAPWLIAFPSLAITLVVLGANLTGQGIQGSVGDDDSAGWF